ncbi:MAG: RpoL/Rpb11 RNA polymerase subunit family protein [Nanoarchaeota archaeon]
MVTSVLKNSKEELEIELDSLTLAEILRVYLNKNPSVSFAAWKREHPTKKPVLLLRVKDKTAKKVLADAVDSITKDLDSIEDSFKKLK